MIVNQRMRLAASDVVILTVPYSALPAIARSVPDWQGKILADATNPPAPGLTGLSVGTSGFQYRCIC